MFQHSTDVGRAAEARRTTRRSVAGPIALATGLVLLVGACDTDPEGPDTGGVLVRAATPPACVPTEIAGQPVCVPTEASWASFFSEVTPTSEKHYLGDVRSQWAIVDFADLSQPPVAWVVHPPAEFVATVLSAERVKACLSDLEQDPTRRCEFTTVDQSLRIYVSARGTVEMYLMIDRLRDALAP